eukprot:gene6060-biopygen13487
MLPIASAVTFYEDCNVGARNARSLMYLLAKQKIQPLKESMGTGSLLLSAAVTWCFTVGDRTALSHCPIAYSEAPSIPLT